jgi:hypothetical protein
VSDALAVGHPLRSEPQSLPDVRGTDAVCAKNRSPDGVAFSFQVSLNSVEPTMPDRCRNLLAKDRCRAALADEAEPDGPEVPGVIDALLLAGC